MQQQELQEGRERQADSGPSGGLGGWSRDQPDDSREREMRRRAFLQPAQSRHRTAR